jgi:hypothetical protein
MAVDNSIGSVSVDIRGDYSRLQADFAAAQGLATKAGAGIAAGLTGGMAPAAAGASLILDKFGVAFRSVAAGAEAATPPVLNLTGGIQRLIIAQALLAQATEASGAAMAHGVSQIQATSGALRVLEGSGGLRAAERFLTMIPGLGAALQYAFPIIGAIALFDIIGRMIDKITGLKEAEDALKSSTQAADEAFAHFEETANRFTVEDITAKFGKARGIAAQGLFDKAKLKEDQEALYNVTTQLAILQKAQATPMRIAMGFAPGSLGSDFRKAEADRLKTLREDVRAAQGQILADQAAIDKTNEDQPRAAAQQAGALASERIANQKSAGDKASELLKTELLGKAKLEHDAETQRIAGLESGYDRTVQTGQEEIRYAKEKQTILNGIALGTLARDVGTSTAPGLISQKFSAASQGQSTEEVAKLRVKAQGELADAQAAYKKETVETQNEVGAATSKAGLSIVEINQRVAQSLKDLARNFDDIDKSADETYKQISKAAEAAIQTTAKVMEIEAKGKGTTDALAIEKEKLLAERAFGLQIVVTGAQRVAYAQQVAALDDKERTAKLTGLAAEYQIALAIDDEGKKKEEVARIEQEMAAESERDANASIAAQTKILELIQKQALEYKLKSAFNNALQQTPGAIGGTVARGVFDGKGIGKDIRDAMKGVGEQLMGAIIKDLIVKMGEEIAAHTIIGVIMTWLGSTQAATAAAQVTATGLNTAQLVILNGLLTTQQATGAAGGIAGAAGGVAGAAGGAAGAAASGLVGPLIAAAGGIIGGVISGVMSLIGAHQIVAAIHGTTAAVQALHGTVTTNAAGTAPATGAAPAPQPGFAASASQGGLFGFAASILGFGGAKPMDVNIVAISPMAGIKGLFNLFGFASGGRPPLGVASIIGERGPELFIPDQAGQVIPAGKWGGMAPGLPNISGVSSSSSQSIGELHVHAHGITNPKEFVRQVARELPNYLKHTSPVYSPASGSR